MRLIFKVGVLRDKPLSLVQASADPSGESVGRWFAAQLDLKTLLATAGIVVGMVTTYVASSNSRTADHDLLTSTVRKQEEDKVAALNLHGESMTAIRAVNDRFDATVVSRTEYQNMVSYLNLQITDLRTQNQQLYNLAVTRAGGPVR